VLLPFSLAVHLGARSTLGDMPPAAPTKNAARSSVSANGGPATSSAATSSTATSSAATSSTATTSTAAASTASADAAQGFTVELMHVSVARPLPEGVTTDDNPFVDIPDPGLDLTLMIRGANIAKLNGSSVYVKTLRTKSGRDLRPEGWFGPGIQSRSEGGHGDTIRFVKVTCPLPVAKKPKSASPDGAKRDGAKVDAPKLDVAQFDPAKLDAAKASLAGLELDGLTIAGTLKVVTFDGTEILQTKPLDLTKKSAEKIKLAGYEIGIEGESDPGGLHAIGTALGEDPERKFVNFSLAGKLDEIADVDVVVGPKRLLWREQDRYGDSGHYAYLKDGDAPGVIEIRRWKNLQKITVPFECRLTPAPTLPEAAKEADKLAAQYSAELIAISAGRMAPAEIPDIARPNHLRNDGFQMKFLLRGPGIVEIQSRGGTADVLRTHDGRDIRLRDGEINYRVNTGHSFDRKPKHHFFEVTSEEPLVGSLDGLQVSGHVTIVAAQGRTTLKSEPIDLTKPGSITLGEWTINYRYEAGDRTFFSAAPIRQGGESSTPPAMREEVEPFQELELSAAGDTDRIVEIEVLVDGKPIQSLGSWSGGGAVARPMLMQPRTGKMSAAPLPPVSFGPPTEVVTPTATGTATTSPTAAPTPAAATKPAAVFVAPGSPPSPAAATLPAGSAPSAAALPAVTTLPATGLPTYSQPQVAAPIPIAIPLPGDFQPPQAGEAIEQEKTASFKFEKPAGPGVIRIHYWKQRREVRVPFSHNMPEAGK